MDSTRQSHAAKAGFRIIHFEALGPEALHLEEQAFAAVRAGILPADCQCLMTHETIQDFLKKNPEQSLPEIITTKTHSLIPEAYLNGNKKSIITRSAGYDHIEHLASKANIASLREYCVNAVAQTAMKMVYATAGELNHYARHAFTFDRKNCNAFMELNKDRVLTVFGVGRIGKKVYQLAQANGLSVQGVDLRQEQLSDLYRGTVKFVSPEQAVASSDIIVNAMNLTRDRGSKFYNVGYFSKELFSGARRQLIFINLTRGEIAPESWLLELYLAKKLIGIGLDVFSSEAALVKALQTDETAGADQAAAKAMIKLAQDRDANIYVQPHQAFNSDLAAKAKAEETLKHIIAWHNRNGQGFDEQLPYY